MRNKSAVSVFQASRAEMNRKRYQDVISTVRYAHNVRWAKCVGVELSNYLFRPFRYQFWCPVTNASNVNIRWIGVFLVKSTILLYQFGTANNTWGKYRFDLFCLSEKSKDLYAGCKKVKNCCAPWQIIRLFSFWPLVNKLKTMSVFIWLNLTQNLHI